MSEPITKSQLLDRTRRARAELDALLARVDDAEMVQAGICGEWSAKDVLAHITWHEREMIGTLQAHALDGSELWDLPLDQRNAAIFEENKDRSLQDVRDETQPVFNLLLQWVESLPEEDLHDPGRFPGMPDDWQPWKLIAENTYEHYEDHIPQFREWLMREDRQAAAFRSARG